MGRRERDEGEEVEGEIREGERRMGRRVGKRGGQVSFELVTMLPFVCGLRTC